MTRLIRTRPLCPTRRAPAGTAAATPSGSQLHRACAATTIRRGRSKSMARSLDAAVRSALIERQEIALLDVRDEAPFADAHPLFAASLPLDGWSSRSAIACRGRRRAIVVYDDGEGLARVAVSQLHERWATPTSPLLEGGLDGWRHAGGELFRDVNVPSKAFGELVEARRHTPSICGRRAQGAARRARGRRGARCAPLRRVPDDEHPDGDQRAGRRAGAPRRRSGARPDTLVVVNCAGRTRSIIGAQSLVNAGMPNRGRGAAQRHDRLDAGRTHARARPVATRSGGQRRTRRSARRGCAPRCRSRRRAAASRRASR